MDRAERLKRMALLEIARIKEEIQNSDDAFKLQMEALQAQKEETCRQLDRDFPYKMKDLKVSFTKDGTLSVEKKECK